MSSTCVEAECQVLCWGQVVSRDSLTTPGRQALFYAVHRQEVESDSQVLCRQGEAKVIPLSGWGCDTDTPGV